MSRGLMIAAPRSASGKTTVTLGLLAALRARGAAPRAAKAGPDYIDPEFHRAASGCPSVNLDSWSMDAAMIASLAPRDGLLVVEAAMGLFDGAGRDGPGGGDGSAASIARLLSLPVVLVLDIAGQAQSAAAVAAGFARHDPGLHVAGVVLNRVASPRHRARAADAIASLGIPVLGALPVASDAGLPERHLGLVQAREHRGLEARLAKLAAFVEEHCDVERIAAAAGPVGPAGSGEGRPAIPAPGTRLAIARDDAFSFLYAHVLAGWRAAGAELVFFSPLADEAPPEADAIWLPGGYPELHAGRLAARSRFLEGLRGAASRGTAVHGECGGYMVLGRTLTDADGVAHAMAGLLDHATDFSKRRLHLGYRRARLATASALGAEGMIVAGHEFHHATLASRGADTPLAWLEDGDGMSLGPEGGVRGRVSGGFFHAIALHS